MKITISNLKYPIKKNKYFWMTARLISIIALSGLFLWSNQKFFTNHENSKYMPTTRNLFYYSWRSSGYYLYRGAND